MPERVRPAIVFDDRMSASEVPSQPFVQYVRDTRGLSHRKRIAQVAARTRRLAQAVTMREWMPSNLSASLKKSGEGSQEHAQFEFVCSNVNSLRRSAQQLKWNQSIVHAYIRPRP